MPDRMRQNASSETGQTNNASLATPMRAVINDAPESNIVDVQDGRRGQGASGVTSLATSQDRVPPSLGSRETSRPSSRWPGCWGSVSVEGEGSRTYTAD